MTNLLNRLVLLLILIILMLSELSIYVSILPIIVVIAICGFLEYFNNDRFNLSVFIAYILLCIIYPEFIYFLPAVFYDLLFAKFQYFILLCVIPVIINTNFLSANTLIILIIVSSVEVLLKHKSIQLNLTESSYIAQRDNLTEKSIHLENKINELTAKQDDEVTIATLNERNRIAREIHDNVGHLLSSSIIQIGAVIATTHEENTKNGLRVVSDTLNDGMNSIRNSVHNLHDNSIDLYMQLKALAARFTFCETKLKYEVHISLNSKTKYAVLSIVKEALNNVIKHSNASEVSISLYEHPKIIQLIILDNGTCSKAITGSGIGLEGIRQRAGSLNGIVNIDNTNGFRIFISFNKEDII